MQAFEISKTERLKQELEPASTAAEALQNTRNIMLTPRGSIPGARGVGLNMDFIDRRSPGARSLTVAAMYEAARHEPRVDIKAITFTGEGSDSAAAKVEVEVADE